MNILAQTVAANQGVEWLAGVIAVMTAIQLAMYLMDRLYKKRGEITEPQHAETVAKIAKTAADAAGAAATNALAAVNSGLKVEQAILQLTINIDRLTGAVASHAEVVKTRHEFIMKEIESANLGIGRILDSTRSR